MFDFGPSPQFMQQRGMWNPSQGLGGLTGGNTGITGGMYGGGFGRNASGFRTRLPTPRGADTGMGTYNQTGQNPQPAFVGGGPSMFKITTGGQLPSPTGDSMGMMTNAGQRPGGLWSTYSNMIQGDGMPPAGMGQRRGMFY